MVERIIVWPKVIFKFGEEQKKKKERKDIDIDTYMRVVQVYRRTGVYLFNYSSVLLLSRICSSGYSCRNRNEKKKKKKLVFKIKQSRNIMKIKQILRKISLFFFSFVIMGLVL